MQSLFGIKPVIAIIITMLVVSCLSTPGPAESHPQAQSHFYGSDLIASEGESEITLNSSSNIGSLSVYLDGALKQTMVPQDSVKLIVPNGPHTLAVNWAGRDKNRLDFRVRGELGITARSESYVINIVLPSLMDGSAQVLIGKVELRQVSVGPLSGGRATRDSQGIGGATIRACEALTEDLPRGANIAVVNIASGDRETAENVIDEIELQLFRTGLFSLVNRNRLDLIRSEQNLGLSGEISDESAASIGRLAGANIVITGSISGSGTTRTLRLTALEVDTGKIIAISGREQF